MLDGALQLTIPDGSIIVDLFAGGGGASTGIEEALGRPVDIAVNHDPDAVSMHRLNHPAAEHFIADVYEVDPIAVCRGRRVRLLHASPDCTHFSQARGGQPRSRTIRALSWVVHKWAGRVRPDVITLENVEQILQWSPLVAKRDKATGRVVKLDGTIAERGERVPIDQQCLVPDKHRLGHNWRHFVAGLRAMGYRVQWKRLRACDYGAPTIRTRLFLVARRDGQPIRWPEPTHAAKPKRGQRAWRSAAECIDFAMPCPSIFTRKRPLAESTMRRIAKGVQRYVLDAAEPFIVPIANWSGENVQPGSEPLRTVTAHPKGGAFAVCAPTIVQTGYGEREGQAPRVPGVGKPLGTIVAGGCKHALATAFLEQANTGLVGHDARKPISTIVGTGSTQRLVECTLSADDEAGAQRVAAFLMRYHGLGGQHGDLRDPATTITTKDRLALVTVVIRGTPYVIVDIGLRMLQPRELYRAQGFPDRHVIDHGHDGRTFSKSAQVRMVGNSVSPPPMAALVRANLGVHASREATAA